MYYKIYIGEPSDIILDLDYEKFEENPEYFKELQEKEIKHLIQEGVNVAKNGDYLIVDNDKIKPKFINYIIITQCDKYGKCYNNIKEQKMVRKQQRKAKIIIDYLKSIGITDCIDKDNLIVFSCPICKKDNQKSFMYKGSLKTFSHSHTDCNHHKEWEQWRKDLKEIWKNAYNPDFSMVKWNENFVTVEFKNENGENTITSLFKYKEVYDECEEPPKIKKFMIQPVVENIEALLEHYRMKLELNYIKASFEIDREKTLDDFVVKVQDYCTKHHFKITKERLIDGLTFIAKSNKYNPIEDYLKKSYGTYLKNPSDLEFRKLLNTIKTDCPHRDEYLYKFLLQMVYVVLNNDNVMNPSQFLLVLQGKQGCGKTTWFKHLIPEHLRSAYWLEGRSLDLTKKDDILESTGTWLTECGEIASTFKKSDQEALKNFITASKDKFRIPYAKEAIVKPRTMSLCATTNDLEYLRDLTGSRRYLTLSTDEINAFHNLDLEMIWGYIYSQYLKNDPYYFSQKRIDEIILENRQYTAKPELLTLIEDYFNLYPNEEDGIWMTAGEIFGVISFENFKLNKFLVGKELKKCNVKNKIKDGYIKYFVKQIKDNPEFKNHVI